MHSKVGQVQGLQQTFARLRHQRCPFVALTDSISRFPARSLSTPYQQDPKLGAASFHCREDGSSLLLLTFLAQLALWTWLHTNTVMSRQDQSQKWLIQAISISQASFWVAQRALMNAPAALTIYTTAYHFIGLKQL